MQCAVSAVPGCQLGKRVRVLHRAVGVLQVWGESFQALVPFLDQANHAPAARVHYSVQGQHFELHQQPAKRAPKLGTGEHDEVAHAQVELMIDYGKKNNRCSVGADLLGQGPEQQVHVGAD